MRLESHSVAIYLTSCLAMSGCGTDPVPGQDASTTDVAPADTELTNVGQSDVVEDSEPTDTAADTDEQTEDSTVAETETTIEMGTITISAHPGLSPLSSSANGYKVCYAAEVLDGNEQRLFARGAADGAFSDAGVGGSGGPANTSGDEASPICNATDDGKGGALTLDAPCSREAPSTSVRLWVQSVCEPTANGICAPLEGFVNPCGTEGCTVTTTCDENKTTATFDLTAIYSLGQGFFDPGYVFDDMFCTAKVEDCNGNNDKIRLIYNADGERVPTLVVALSCVDLSEDADFAALNLTNLDLECDGASGSLSFAGLTEFGMLPAGTLPWPTAIYTGLEDLGTAKKVYFNIAVGLDDATNCELNWRASPAHGALPAWTLPPYIDHFATTGLIAFDAVVPGGATCTHKTLFDATDAIRPVHNPRPDGGPFVTTEAFNAVVLPSATVGEVRVDARE